MNRAATNMSILASELARMAGPKCQETVSAAMKRWEEKIRERVRLEMALKLADDSGWGRQVQRVAVIMSDGLPLALLAHERDLTEELPEIAGMFRSDLLSFKEAAAALQQLLDRLGKLDTNWTERAKAEHARIVALEALTGELLELAKRATLRDRLKAIDEDIDVNELTKAFEDVRDRVKDEIEWLYETRCESCQGIGIGPKRSRRSAPFVLA